MKTMIDLRSDTVTAPTDKMRQAIAAASVGDDVYGDDLLTVELEKLAAKMVGKEAAVFVPSGTFANQLALLTHTNRADEVVLGHDCHIVIHEVGGSALIAGVQLRTARTQFGTFNLDELKSLIRDEDIHFPKTGLICVENAHSSGAVVPLDNMKAVYQLARERGIPVHLDGARVFNAATALDVSIEQIAKYCDSVNICLSKGLCAPIGSLLVGNQTFIDKARKNRKAMGGGMRQTGILAAAAKIALEEMSLRLKQDHKTAERLANGLAQISGVEVALKQRDINMVFFKLPTSMITEKTFIEGLEQAGILANGMEDGLYRFVTHYWVTDEAVDRVLATIKKILIPKS